MISFYLCVDKLCNRTAARRVHHVEAGQRVGHPAERGGIRERVHGAQDRVLDQVHRPLLPGNERPSPWLIRVSSVYDMKMSF